MKKELHIHNFEVFFDMYDKDSIQCSLSLSSSLVPDSTLEAIGTGNSKPLDNGCSYHMIDEIDSEQRTFQAV